jgi:hypothetical protein
VKGSLGSTCAEAGLSGHRVTRYGAHLYKALPEPGVLSTSRSGGIAPLARVDMQSLSES